MNRDDSQFMEAVIRISVNHRSVKSYVELIGIVKNRYGKS